MLASYHSIESPQHMQAFNKTTLLPLCLSRSSALLRTSDCRTSSGSTQLELSGSTQWHQVRHQLSRLELL